MNTSVNTTDIKEFINLQPSDISPLVTECQIKVMYVGENRNGSFINKEVATEMAKTLRTCPIVGYYKEDKEDFADHGQRITIDGGEIKFDCMTVPYGFVAPDADIWFEKFNDIDDFGNSVEHEYLMTNGYLWTGQFEEAKLAIEGRPQSMELDEKSLDGKWSYDPKTQMDFFIINDATFSKLCILGEDVEPCFEGAAVNAKYTLDDGFKKSLFTMMHELENMLQGGSKMDNTVELNDVENEVELDTPAEGEVDFAAKKDDEESTDPKENNQDNSEDNKDDAEKDDEDKTKHALNKEDEKDSEEDKEDKTKHAAKDEKEEADDAKAAQDEEDKKTKNTCADDEDKKYSLVKEELETLKANYAALEEQNKELLAFKAGVERAEKEALINSFTMLTDDDKANVMANIDTYSLKDIKSELAVICFDKKISFSDNETTDGQEDDQQVNLTFSLNEGTDNDLDNADDIILALRRTREELKNK